VAAGAVVRRTMPALAVVFGAFIGRTVLMAKYRPEFMTPVTMVKDYSAGRPSVSAAPLRNVVANTMSLDPGGNPQLVDAAGRTFPINQAMDTWCQPTAPGDPSDAFVRTCFQQHHIIGALQRFQPASRMGTFHLIENGLNLGLLVLSLAVTWWFVRRARTAV
jgi:hypothetical protein